jgi:hypothetical protein
MRCKNSVLPLASCVTKFSFAKPAIIYPIKRFARSAHRHKRDHTLICVVEDTRDVMAIENTNQYNGFTMF